VVTAAEQQQNRTSLINSTSQHRGVSWTQSVRRWRAQGAVGRVTHHLGYFASEEDAAKAAAAFRAANMPYSDEAREAVR
jgi:hypothetical protein